MKDSLKLTLASALAVIALALSPAAHALVMTDGCMSNTHCSFAELEAGGSITVNDKLFSSWFFEEEGDISPDWENIVVSGLDDGGLDPGPGLKYSFNGELTLTEDDGETLYTLSLEYEVTVLDNSLRIKDNSLTLSDTRFEGTGGIIEIFEEIENDQGDLIGEKFVFADNFFDEFMLTDSATFDPESSIFVFKDIFLDTDGEPGTVVELAMFEQRFSQMRVNGIPEPGAFALFGIGLAGLALLRRRRTA